MIKIAHVDDDNNFSFLMYTLMNQYQNVTGEKVDFVSFERASDFMEVFSENREEFDLVLLDIQLDDATGYEVAQEIYDNSSHDILPVVIILSTHVSPEETFASLMSKIKIDFHEIINRFKLLSQDSNHRNMTDIFLRAEDYSNGLAHI